MQGQKSSAERSDMARAYHVLAGVCRDLRAACIAASEGDSEAQKLADDFNDALELHDALCSGELDSGADSDDSASGDDAEDASDTGHGDQYEQRRMERMGNSGQGPSQRSTRRAAQQPARPSPGLNQRLMPGKQRS